MCKGQPEGSEGQPKEFEGLTLAEGLLEESQGMPEGFKGLPVRSQGPIERLMDKHNFSPIYRTLSPTEAAAQKEGKLKGQN